MAWEGNPSGRPKSDFEQLKERIILDIMQVMDSHGHVPNDLEFPTSKQDMDEVQMLLDDLYPNNEYRAVELLPTDAGKRKYDPDGYYDDIPCTCECGCRTDCKGGCGCEACRVAYGDYLSSQ